MYLKMIAIILAVTFPVIAFSVEDGPTINSAAADAYAQEMAGQNHGQQAADQYTVYHAEIQAALANPFSGPTAFTWTTMVGQYQSPVGLVSTGDGIAFMINRNHGTNTVRVLGSTPDQNWKDIADVSAYNPTYMAAGLDNSLYFVDSTTKSIVKVKLSITMTQAGPYVTAQSVTPITTNVPLVAPAGVAVDADGTIYVVDGDLIKKITTAGVVTVLAGSSKGSANGTGTAAQFNGPTHLAIDLYFTGALYVCDNGNFTIRKVIISSGVVTTLAGRPGVQGWVDGEASAAEFTDTQGIGVDPAGNVFVLDQLVPTADKQIQAFTYNPIRMIVNGVVSTPQVYNDGLPHSLGFVPYGLAIDSAGTLWTFSDAALDTTSASWMLIQIKPKAEAPVVIENPSDQTVANAGTAAFTAVVVGTKPFRCQWYHDGVLIQGATSLVYTISSASSADAGKYHVVVINDFGTATSTDATLTLGAPAITTQPSSVAVMSGQTATFSVGASGSNLAYQWYGPSGAIAGATGSSYSVTATAGGSYYVIVSNSFGSATSNTATLTVSQPSPPPGGGGGGSSGGGGGGGAPSVWFMGALAVLAIVKRFVRQKVLSAS